MYSEMYYQQIKDLQEWYELQLKSFPVLNISEADYKKGIDALPEAYRQLNLTAFNKWLNEKNYELSYSQSCSALFAAMNHLGLINVGITGYIIKSGKHSLTHPLSKNQMGWWTHYRNTDCYVHPEATLKKLTPEFTESWAIKPTHAIPAKYEDGVVTIIGKPFKI